jgi:hypothetical protein
MDHEELLFHLEALASSLGINVSYENFLSPDWYTSSGLCRIGDELRIIIDKSLHPGDKVSALARALRGFDFEKVFCPPLVRQLIEEGV